MTMSFTPEQLERIELWEQELRNSERKQGTGRLAYRETTGPDKGVIKYCCLGIGCEVAIANGLEVNRVESNMNEIHFSILGVKVIEYDGERDHLPWAVAEWYGLNQNPNLLHVNEDGEDIFDTAASLNDGDASDLDEGLTFPEIADAIRRTYREGRHGQDPDVLKAATSHTQTQQ